MNRARCAVCGRVGDRRCPATDQFLCSSCCGSHRGRLIRCVQDCAYLQAAEERLRARRARELERAWATWFQNLVGRGVDPDELGRYVDVLADVLADLLRRAPADDMEIEAALRHLDRALSPVVLVDLAPPPLGRALAEIFVPLHRKGEIDGEKVRQAARELATWLAQYRSEDDPVKFARGLLGLFPEREKPREPGLILRPDSA